MRFREEGVSESPSRQVHPTLLGTSLVTTAGPQHEVRESHVSPRIASMTREFKAFSTGKVALLGQGASRVLLNCLCDHLTLCLNPLPPREELRARPACGGSGTPFESAGLLRNFQSPSNEAHRGT